MVILKKKNSEKNRNFYFKLYIFHIFDSSEKIHEVTKIRPLPNFNFNFPNLTFHK